MVSFFSILLTIIATAVSIPIVVVFVECFFAIVAKKPAQLTVKPNRLPRTAILIPAHNEAAVIGQTLSRLQPELSGNEEIIVIADNCTDQTAEISRSFDVTVLERFNSVDRGKGFALDHGINHLRQNPPDIVVMLDADSHFESGGLGEIVQLSFDQKRPVQAIYLIESPDNPSANDQVSAFAFLVKNLVRPLGLSMLGQPCLLTGTGMAFPWEIISTAPLASGNIVEDMQLGLDLAVEGHPPLLAPASRIWSVLPQQKTAATTQRTRWEHGHIQTLVTQVPRLLKARRYNSNSGLFSLAADLLVPPLALLVILWGLVSAIGLVFGIVSKRWFPAKLLGLTGSLLLVSIGGAWSKFGRKTLPFRTLLSVPFYILWKVPLYIGYLVKRQTAWVRTDRDG